MSIRPGFREPEAVAALIDTEIQNAENMEAYIHKLQCDFKNLGLFAKVHEFASVVGPRDPQLGPESGIEAAGAFFRGGMLGLRASRLLVSTAVANIMDREDVLLPVPDIDQITDPYEKIHAVAASIVEVGRNGIEMWAAFRPHLTEWEQYVTPDVRQQSFVSHGFGVVLKHMSDAIDLSDLQDIQFQVDALEEYDGWDAALADLDTNI